jgi:hypothetical protein
MNAVFEEEEGLKRAYAMPVKPRAASGPSLE